LWAVLLATPKMAAAWLTLTVTLVGSANSSTGFCFLLVIAVILPYGSDSFNISTQFGQYTKTVQREI
jgi:hypothetical protein